MSDRALFAGMVQLGRRGFPLRMVPVALDAGPERAALAIATASTPSLTPRSAGEIRRLAVEPRPMGLA
jgi:hypothetical protein